MLLLAACQSPSNQASSSAAPVDFRYINFQVYDSVYVGLDNGYFAKRGLNVQIVGDVLGGPNAVQAVAGGSAEGGLAAIPALANARAAGLDVVGVSDLQSTLPNQPLERYYVRANSPLHTIEDLAHQSAKPKFAINNLKASFHYTALMAFGQHGVAENAVDFVLLPFDQQQNALLNGSVDVVGLLPPYDGALEATAAGQVRQLFDANDVFGSSEQFTLQFLNGPWARAHPDQAKAFVAGVVESVDWIETHQGAAAAIVANHTGMDAKYIGNYHYQPHAQVDDTAITFWVDYLVGRGDLKQRLSPADVATNQYNEAVK
jgi:ABC-type nitrate/sulfonate/bicarbonate transport system substrate-binding protein